MTQACRDLLDQVLKTARFSRKLDASESFKGIRKSKCLIDLGFGCGEQTIYLTSAIPIRNTDTEWWATSGPRDCPRLDAYVGITLDEKQYRFAQERIRDPLIEWKRRMAYRDPNKDAWGKHVVPKLFCADAANPEAWSENLKWSIQSAVKNTEEHWVLALDTAYHFSPSRWPMIHYAFHTLNASFMGFDLCISPTISSHQKVLLRILTRLMGAPWANFITPDEYRQKLVEVGFDDSQITIRDISDDVFGPLARYLEGQDRRLRVIGYGLGPFNVARLMFKWWGESGAVRGIIVVAKKQPEKTE